MKCGQHILLYVKEVTEFFCEVGHESRVTITNDLLWDAEPQDQVSEIQCCDFLSGDRGFAWDEFSRF